MDHPFGLPANDGFNVVQGVFALANRFPCFIGSGFKLTLALARLLPIFVCELL